MRYKKYSIIILFCLFSLPFVLSLETVDKIIAIIYHPEGSSIILQSDLKLGIEDINLTKEEAILRKLMEIDAQVLNLQVSDEEVDRRWDHVKKIKNLTQEQMLEAIKPYTVEQVKEELKKQIIIDNILQYRVLSKIYVEKKDIEKYYKENPVYKEATYRILKAFVPFESDSSPTIKRLKLEQSIENGDIEKLVKWDDPLELEESQIADDKAYIKNMQVGSIILVNSNKNDGIFVFKLLAKSPKRLLSLEERENEIFYILQKEQYDKLFEAYRQKLLGVNTSKNGISVDPRIAVIKYID